jgi:hypothetical protein
MLDESVKDPAILKRQPMSITHPDQLTGLGKPITVRLNV